MRSGAARGEVSTPRTQTSSEGPEGSASRVSRTKDQSPSLSMCSTRTGNTSTSSPAPTSPTIGREVSVVERCTMRAGLKCQIRSSELSTIVHRLEAAGFTSRASLELLHDTKASMLGVPAVLARALREDARGPPAWAKRGKVPKYVDTVPPPVAEGGPRQPIEQAIDKELEARCPHNGDPILAGFPTALREYRPPPSSPQQRSRTISETRCFSPTLTRERAESEHVERQRGCRINRSRSLTVDTRLSGGRTPLEAWGDSDAYDSESLLSKIPRPTGVVMGTARARPACGPEAWSRATDRSRSRSSVSAAETGELDLSPTVVGREPRRESSDFADHYFCGGTPRSQSRRSVRSNSFGLVDSGRNSGINSEPLHLFSRKSLQMDNDSERSVCSPKAGTRSLAALIPEEVASTRLPLRKLQLSTVARASTQGSQAGSVGSTMHSTSRTSPDSVPSRHQEVVVATIQDGPEGLFLPSTCSTPSSTIPSPVASPDQSLRRDRNFPELIDLSAAEGLQENNEEQRPTPTSTSSPSITPMSSSRAAAPTTPGSTQRMPLRTLPVSPSSTESSTPGAGQRISLRNFPASISSADLPMSPQLNNPVIKVPRTPRLVQVWPASPSGPSSPVSSQRSVRTVPPELEGGTVGAAGRQSFRSKGLRT